MIRNPLLAAMFLAAAAPALAQEPKLPYKIHTITGVEKLEPNLYSFATEAGRAFEVAAADAGIAQDLLHGDAFSQDYHCALRSVADDQYHIVGCSGVGVPGPLRLP